MQSSKRWTRTLLLVLGCGILTQFGGCAAIFLATQVFGYLFAV